MKHYEFLVTGAGGFIGRYVTALLDASWFGVQGRQQCDLTDIQQVLALPPANVVYHLAGQSGIHGYTADPWQTYQANTTATLNMLEYARQNRCQRFIIASSCLYGKPIYLPIDENHPLKPHNGYAMSKYLAEQLVMQYSHDFHIPVILARLFNVYGSGQSETMLIPSILAQLLHQKQIVLRDPYPSRDFIHVEDVASAFLKMGQMAEHDLITILNIGSGSSHSVTEVVNMLLAISGRQVPVTYLNQIRSNEVNDVVADISKAQKYLNWEPQVQLEDGLKQLYKRQT